MLEHPGVGYGKGRGAPGGASASKAEDFGSSPVIQMLRSRPYAVQTRLLKPGGAVQRDGGKTPQSETESVHQAAAHGIQGGGGAMPHLTAIQQSFGSHDVSSIQAHTDSAASQANEAMGAEAYATGNHVAFKGTPDLHTAAHEAAHVVQQRSGVSLSGGVGAVGDSYEQHADAVADAVVAGQSAEGLLNGMGGGPSVQQKTVQQRADTIQRKEAAGGAKAAEKPARVHLLADLDVADLNKEALEAGDVGHTWVALQWKDPTAVPDTIAANHKSYLQGAAKGYPLADQFGFWPKNGYETEMYNKDEGLKRSYVAGEMRHPDDTHEGDQKAQQSWDISEKQAQDVIKYAESKRGAKYSVFFYNCTTFGVEAIKAAGLSAPSGGYMGICYPNKLYDSIKARHQAGEGDTMVTEMDGTAVPKGTNRKR